VIGLKDKVESDLPEQGQRGTARIGEENRHHSHNQTNLLDNSLSRVDH
jgi:hypothetical protein